MFQARICFSGHSLYFTLSLFSQFPYLHYSLSHIEGCLLLRFMILWILCLNWGHFWTCVWFIDLLFNQHTNFQLSFMNAAEGVAQVHPNYAPASLIYSDWLLNTGCVNIILEKVENGGEQLASSLIFFKNIFILWLFLQLCLLSIRWVGSYQHVPRQAKAIAWLVCCFLPRWLV